MRLLCRPRLAEYPLPIKFNTISGLRIDLHPPQNMVAFLENIRFPFSGCDSRLSFSYNCMLKKRNVDRKCVVSFM